MARQRNNPPAEPTAPATPTALAVRNREIRRVRVGDIVDNPKNYRTHDDLQRSSFRATVGEIGWYGYPDVFEHPDFPGRVMLIDGELRSHHLAEHYGPDAFIDVNLTDFSPTEADTALATKDPLAGMAGVEKTILAGLLNELEAGSAEFEALIATLAEREKIDLDRLEAVPTTGLTDPDDVPDLPADPITKPGDLWLLGEHRLLCGDSTKAEDVERLMGNDVSDMMLTDPPYGVSYVGKTEDALKVENDNLDEDGLAELCKRAFDLAQQHMRGGAYWYATVPPGPLHLVFADDWKRRGVLRQIMVWAKDSMVLGHSEYHYQHEPILFGWIPGDRHHNADRTRTTLWACDRPKASREHPTMKPVALWARAIGDGSRTNEIVYDPFLGSGTTLIAAEQLNRRCFGMEISPQYCDVIVARWEAFSGQRATRVSACTSQPEIDEPNSESTAEPAQEAPARRGRSYLRATGVNPNLPPTPKPAARRGRPRKK